MRVLITGASGMVGHYLVEKCIERKYIVVATDIRYNAFFDKYEYLFRFEFKKRSFKKISYKRKLF